MGGGGGNRRMCPRTTTTTNVPLAWNTSRRYFADSWRKLPRPQFRAPCTCIHPPSATDSSFAIHYLFSSEATISFSLLYLCFQFAFTRRTSGTVQLALFPRCGNRALYTNCTLRIQGTRRYRACRSLASIRQFQEERGIQTKPQALALPLIHLLVSLNITGQGTKMMMRK